MLPQCPLSSNKPVDFKTVSNTLNFDKIESTVGSERVLHLVEHCRFYLVHLISYPEAINSISHDQFLSALNWAFQEPLYDGAVENIQAMINSEKGVYDGENSVGKVTTYKQLRNINDIDNIPGKVEEIGKHIIKVLHESFIKSYEAIKNGGENSSTGDIYRFLKIMNPDMKYMYQDLDHKGFIYNNCYALEITLHTIQNAIKIYIEGIQDFLLKNDSKVDFEKAIHNSKGLFVNYAMSGDFIKVIKKMSSEYKKKKLKYDILNHKFIHNISKAEFTQHIEGLIPEYGESRYRGCALLYKDGGNFGGKNALLDFNLAIFELFLIYLERVGLLK